MSHNCCFCLEDCDCMEDNLETPCTGCSMCDEVRTNEAAYNDHLQEQSMEFNFPPHEPEDDLPF